MILAAILASAVMAAAPPPKEVSPLVVVPQPKDAPHPDAVIAIGAEDLAQGQSVSLWPARALGAGSNGYVTLRCVVDTHGLAETCRVIYETPKDRGFGAAALALRPTFKLNPRQEPAELNIAIGFRAPQSESNYDDVRRASEGQIGGGSVGLEDGASNGGHHEINGRNLIIYHNPVATRSLTMMTDPVWASAPGFEEWAAAYPTNGGGLEGYVVVHCRVQRTGALQGCSAVKETPTGHGFGKAALGLSARFRTSAEAMAAAPKGAPVEVDIPIRFAPPQESTDRSVRAPVWIAGADPVTRAAALPPGRADSPGALVKCQVGEGGGLTGCALELTSPDGLDFDEAAVKLATSLRMNLWSAEAGPVLGGIVHLPVRRDLGQEPRAEK